MARQNQTSIVFAHGLWAAGSCFQKLIPALQADGHEVMCSQHSATEDRTIQPELERFVAKRMGATTVELRSSHVPISPSHRLCWT